jgi:hypothetical protein
MIKKLALAVLLSTSLSSAAALDIARAKKGLLSNAPIEAIAADGSDLVISLKEPFGRAAGLSRRISLTDPGTIGLRCGRHGDFGDRYRPRSR